MDKVMSLFKPKEDPKEEQILKLDEVIVDNDLNPRDGALDQDVILDYSTNVDELPPMHAFDIQGFYYLAGGFHRYAAYRLAGRDEARFVIHRGAREEAKEFADLDNLKHGLRLTRAERRKVIERQLRRHPDWSDARLAAACYTTDKTVRVIREALEQTSEIPRFDALVGSDGITRPRMVSKPAPEVEPDRQPSFEAAAPIAPALLKPVEQLEEEAAERAMPGWMGDTGGPGLDATDTDDAGENLPDEMEAEDDATPAPTETLPDETQAPVSLPAAEAAAPSPPPEPAAPPPPPPPPTVGEAPWVLSISVRGETPPLITILHGTLPVEHLPDDVAQRIIDAIWAKAEPLPTIVETTDAPEGVPDWLIEK